MPDSRPLTTLRIPSFRTGAMLALLAAATTFVAFVVADALATRTTHHTCNWGASSILIDPQGHVHGPHTTGCVKP